jgi:hypothetical protein
MAASRPTTNEAALALEPKPSAGAELGVPSTWSCAMSCARHADWPLQDLYVTFRKEILPDEEANMLAIPRKQRAMVRKGIKNGLVGAARRRRRARFFALYADNVHRHGTPAMPKRYFEALRATFGDRLRVLTVTAPTAAAVQRA